MFHLAFLLSHCSRLMRHAGCAFMNAAANVYHVQPAKPQAPAPVLNQSAISIPVDLPNPYHMYGLNDFQLLQVVGRGGFGKVFLAEDLKAGLFCAIKAIRQDKLTAESWRAVEVEKRVLVRSSECPYLAHLYATFTAPGYVFFSMEFLNGGDLGYHLNVCGYFDHDTSRFYAAEISAGLQFLHKNGIIYRDLKPENVLLDYRGHCRLADFGLCHDNEIHGSYVTSICGTWAYMAPEMLCRKPYDYSVDWWSYGIVCYQMLCGETPFCGYSKDELINSILSDRVKYPRRARLSACTIHFISKLLRRDPAYRLGCIEGSESLRQHAFFKQIDWIKLDENELVPPYLPEVTSLDDTTLFDTGTITEPPKLSAQFTTFPEFIYSKIFYTYTYTSPGLENSLRRSR